MCLDEVSFDSHGCWHTRDYVRRGRQDAVRGGYRRMPRVSMLMFISAFGIAANYTISGTFTRKEFARCCTQFLRSDKVKPRYGYNSVWIMDGALIHCCPRILHRLRQNGVKSIFLSAYCPSSTTQSR